MANSTWTLVLGQSDKYQPGLSQHQKTVQSKIRVMQTCYV